LRETTSDRVLKVLALFRTEPVTWTVDQAAEKLGYPVSTTYRYFRSLAASELITTYLPGHYTLGPAIIEYDRKLRLHDPLIAASTVEMHSLADVVDGATNILLTRLYDLQIMCVNYVSRAKLPFDLGYERGRRMPLDKGATGKIVLANMSSLAVKDIVKNVLCLSSDEAAKLQNELKHIRGLGYAITEGEISEGARGIAVPVFGPDEKLEGSLSLVTSQDDKRTLEYVKALIRARKTIEANLAIYVLNQEAID